MRTRPLALRHSLNPRGSFRSAQKGSAHCYWIVTSCRWFRGRRQGLPNAGWVPTATGGSAQVPGNTGGCRTGSSERAVSQPLAAAARGATSRCGQTPAQCARATHPPPDRAGSIRSGEIATGGSRYWRPARRLDPGSAERRYCSRDDKRLPFTPPSKRAKAPREWGAVSFLRGGARGRNGSPGEGESKGPECRPHGGEIALPDLRLVQDHDRKRRPRWARFETTEVQS